MITTNKKLKILTIISHGFIIIGAGHGIACLFVIEILWFPYLAKDNFSISFSGVDNHFPVVGLTTLVGQASLLCSILLRRQGLKNMFQVAGVFFLWLGLIYFICDTTSNTSIHIASITAIPFAICTIITLLGIHLRRFYYWVVDN
jgi:hypothetical protein